MSTNADGSEPKITLRYVSNVTKSGMGAILNFAVVPLSFINLGIGACLIGFAADSINWTKARGGWAADDTATAVVYAPNERNPYGDLWATRMKLLPSHLDNSMYFAFIVAGVVLVLLGLVVVPLSFMHWKSQHQRVSLNSSKGIPSHPRTVIACLLLDAIMFVAAVITLIAVRDLYHEETGYAKYDNGWSGDDYYIQAKYFDPPLPPAVPYNGTWEPVDDIVRSYRSPVTYNPLNWECRLQGHILYPHQHRVWKLCEEGNAARWLLVTVVGTQGIVFLLHVLALWKEKYGGHGTRMRERLLSEENVGETSERQ